MPPKARDNAERDQTFRADLLRWSGSAAMVLFGLLASAYLAWIALSAVNFFYPGLYAHLEIDAHIERFGPENRYREGFEATTDAQRIALFSRIVEAINNDGRGLAALSYRPGGDGDPVPLLRPPEIEHLRLVGAMVTDLRRVGLVALALFAATVAVLAYARVQPTRMLRFAGIAIGIGAAGALVFASFDVTDTGWFARLHDWAFPPDHQWFFYYQDSLMTTLMKAPDLFGPMAIALAGTTMAIYLLLLAGARRLLIHRGSNQA